MVPHERWLGQKAGDGDTELEIESCESSNP
jgi:hypothetical protein